MKSLLWAVYPDHSDEELTFVWSQLMQILEENSGIDDFYRFENQQIWDASSVVLITYPDAIYTKGIPTLRTLEDFIDKKFSQLSTVVHILPFLPSTSDGGFAVSNYEEIEASFGDWADLKRFARKHKIMADFVLNHVSSSHPWVKQFTKCEEPGKSFILSPKVKIYWNKVVRPRNSSLFTQLYTSNGNKDVWTTFGPDQIDLNWGNPRILIEFLRLLVTYTRNGVSWLRLDAIAFIWKEPKTNCLHRQEVHKLVKILRIQLRQLLSEGVLITETNVPEKENLSYLETGDEANIAYNFSLPPLLLECLLSNKADVINKWLDNKYDFPANTTLLNFTASHDGVGLRGLEGIMNKDRIHKLLVNIEERGGLISHRRLSNGQDQPYELNISWWSAMADGGSNSTYLQLERFLLSQMFVLALKGVPAFYLQAILASSNDIVRFKRTGQRRDLNRSKFEVNSLQRELRNENSPASINIKFLNEAMQIRSSLQAFHPESPMRCLSSERSDCVIIERGFDRQKVFAIHNMTQSLLSLDLKKSLKLNYSSARFIDCLDNCHYNSKYISLSPFKVVWLRLLA